MLAMETTSPVGSDMSYQIVAKNFQKKSTSLVAFTLIFVTLVINIQSSRGS